MLVGGGATQRDGQRLEGGGAVEVVGVDHREGPRHRAAGGQHGVTGTPGLGPKGAQVVLVDQPEGQGGAMDPGQVGFHQRAKLAAHDEHDLVEPGPAGVRDGVVHDGLTVGADLGQLLGAPETGSQAGGQHHQARAVRVRVAGPAGDAQEPSSSPSHERKTRSQRSSWSSSTYSSAVWALSMEPGPNTTICSAKPS